MAWRDENGKALTDYPRPSVAVDVSVLTVVDEQLNVVVVQSPWGPALPGTFIHPGETLADAAERALATKAGVSGLEFYQLGMFDAPARDNRGWVLSMAHGAAVRIAELPAETELMPITDGRPESTLAFDHADMVAASVVELRNNYAAQVDPARLLPASFTLLQLRRLYEVVFHKQLPKDSFRRHFDDALTGTGRLSSAAGGRPAELYARASGKKLPETAAAFLRG